MRGKFIGWFGRGASLYRDTRNMVDASAKKQERSRYLIGRCFKRDEPKCPASRKEDQ